MFERLKGKRLSKAPDKKALVEHANDTAKAAQLALNAVNLVGGEWRAFTQLGIGGRLWWMVSGQIGFGPWARAKARIAAFRQRRQTAPSEGAIA